MKQVLKKTVRWRSPLLLGWALLFILGSLRGFALDPGKSVLQYNGRSWGRQNGFHIQARGADSTRNQPGDAVKVALRPHFYQAAGFKLACALLGLAGLGGIYTWRFRQLDRGQRALQEARDLLEAKVKEQAADLAKANNSLSEEIQQRVRAQALVEEQKAKLEKEIEERRRMESETERIHKELVDASRQAGKAEVASSVLHNVGNVLNSINISATVVGDRLRNLHVANLAKAADLIQQHDPAALGRFLTEDEKGQQLPVYLKELARHLMEEQTRLLKEISDLSLNLEHVKEIVAMQQAYAKMAGAREKIAVTDLVESALKLHSGAYLRHAVKVVRDYKPVPAVTVDRHKVLQVLVNFFHNAKYACTESKRDDRQVTVRISTAGSDRVQVEVEDNGVGIPPENLERIFAHGFTTRKDGHGFGLYSASLAAKDLGGKLAARSDGPGKGSMFALEFPIQPPPDEALEPPQQPAQAPPAQRPTELEAGPAVVAVKRRRPAKPESRRRSEDTTRAGLASRLQPTEMVHPG